VWVGLRLSAKHGPSFPLLLRTVLRVWRWTLAVDPVVDPAPARKLISAFDNYDNYDKFKYLKKTAG